MKLAITTTTDTGKRQVSAANEYIDIDITANNRIIARLRVQDDSKGKTLLVDQKYHQPVRHNEEL
jgi:hypothetical protein